MFDRDSFRLKLKARRKAMHMTQAQLGRACEVSAQEISHFETGRRIPELDMLVKLCSALNTNPNALLIDSFLPDKLPEEEAASVKEGIRTRLDSVVGELNSMLDYFS